MKQLLAILVLMFAITSCSRELENTSALDEQKKTEANQRDLNAIQPAPKISWSLERDNLIKRFKLQNDRSISFYMYVFVEGVGEPIGYYQVLLKMVHMEQTEMRSLGLRQKISISNTTCTTWCLQSLYHSQNL